MSKLGEGQYNIFDLTKAQKKKLNALKRAYKACLESGMVPVNIYGSLTFYDKKFIKDYGDSNSGFDKDLSVKLRGNSRSFNCLRIPSEWADDGHIILLTKEGKEIFETDLEDDHD